MYFEKLVNFQRVTAMTIPENLQMSLLA